MHRAGRVRVEDAPGSGFMGFVGLYSLGTPEPSSHNPKPYSPPYVDRIWGICGSYYNMPKATFCLLKEGYTA